MDPNLIRLDDDDPRATLIKTVLEDKELPLFNLISDVLTVTSHYSPDELVDGVDERITISLPVPVVDVLRRRMRAFDKERQHDAKSYFIKTMVVRGLQGCLDDFERRGDFDWHRETMVKLLNVLGIDYDDTLLASSNQPSKPGKTD